MNANAGIRLFHIIIIGSLFLYVGISGINMPAFMYPILLVLGAIVILYHGFLLYKKLIADKNPWIPVIHVFLIGPILLVIGLKKEHTQRFYFELLLMLGFASIGYHGYYLFQ